jgi:gas vesicle protein
MDYLSDFRMLCKSHLNSKVVKPPVTATKKQQKYEFERVLKMTKQKLAIELEQFANQQLDLAAKKGFEETSKLWSDMKNEIRTLLRDWQEIQEDNSGLYD